MKGKRILYALILIVQVCSLPAQTYNDYIGAGHDLGVTIKTSSENGGDVGENTINGFGLIADEVQSSRLLAQTTFGANYEMLQAVTNQGLEAWLDEQLAMNPTYLVDNYDLVLANFPVNDINTFHALGAWWHTAITAPDQLRQRVAMALSQILVVSYQSGLVGSGNALVSYYTTLQEHALGNYRDLLYDVSLHPAMGFYLSHINNPRTIQLLNIHPDENYAREIMQLFSIGLYELNIDGTRKLDAEGNFIPTYDNEDIRQLAKVFTGLGGAALNELGVALGYPGPAFGIPFIAIDATQPMVMYPAWHEGGQKRLLNDFIIPAGQTGMEDIEDAIDHLFQHPNVGPFLARHLIQRLVKSNPSPDYIARVATVFNDNGNGVRGDMAAFIRSIIMDPEARDCTYLQDDENGRLKEPIVRYTQLLRSFDVTNDKNIFADPGIYPAIVLLQNIMGAPSVFNFYAPTYSPNGEIKEAGLVAPEFQILNSNSSIGYINLAELWTLGLQPMTIFSFPDGNDPNILVSQLNLQEETLLASDPAALVDRLDIVLCHGQMTAHTRQVIIDAVGVVPSPQFDYIRVQLALYLTMISPDFVVMR